MRRHYLLGILTVVIACLGPLAASGLAAEFEAAKWLVNGEQVTSALLFEDEIILLEEDTSTGAHTMCSLLYIGFVLPGNIRAFTEVLMLTGTKVEELSGSGVKCLGLGACNEEEDAELWPLKLPWTGELDLKTSTGAFVELLFGVVDHVLCLIVGIAAEEECSLAEGTGYEVLNVTGGDEMMGAPTERGNCTTGGAGTDDSEFEAGNLNSVSEGTLSASE